MNSLLVCAFTFLFFQSNMNFCQSSAVAWKTCSGTECTPNSYSQKLDCSFDPDLCPGECINECFFIPYNKRFCYQPGTQQEEELCIESECESDADCESDAICVNEKSYECGCGERVCKDDIGCKTVNCRDDNGCGAGERCVSVHLSCGIAF